MPITQDRFLAVVNGGAHLISYHRELQNQILFNLAEDISEANSAIAIAHTLGHERLADALERLKTRLIAAKDSVLVGTATLADYNAVILAEQRHFQKVGTRNRKNAFHIAQRREQQAQDNGKPVRHNNAGPTFSELNPPPPDLAVERLDERAAVAVAELIARPAAEPDTKFTETEEYKAFTEEMKRRRKNALPSVLGPTLGTAPELSAKPTQWVTGKDGVRRERPADDILNAPPITSGRDLL